MFPWHELLGVILFLAILFVVSYPLSGYLEKIIQGERTFLSPILEPVENIIYKLCRINEEESLNWIQYATRIIFLGLFSFLFTFLILKFQNNLPWNPQHFPNLNSNLALNIAMSFTTNTNWQSAASESTLSYCSQMLALTPQLFLSAATAIAGLFAIMRGLSQEKNGLLGNFSVDVIRICLYLFLPLSILLALFYISQGVVQNLSPYSSIHTLEGGIQTLAQGPVASFESIKMLGTNGGGFFNTNSAHPFESPSALVNFLQIFSALLIPSSLVLTYGRYIQHFKHALSIWCAMAILLLCGTCFFLWADQHGSPMLSHSLHLNSSVNLEGKELRFGGFLSGLFSDVTTAVSLGASNLAHSSLVPLASLVCFLNMLLNEVIFGGAGSGLYGMILHVILAVFIAGLMVGRTPEYLGKKIESQEIKLTLIPMIGVSACILIFSAIATSNATALSSVGNPGAHGFSEILYALTSTVQNNGSAMSSLNANTPFWNGITALAMFFGRFLNLIPLLALASLLSKKKSRHHNGQAFPVHGPLFVTLLIAIIVVVGALSYLPGLALGPVMEHLQTVSAKQLIVGGH